MGLFGSDIEAPEQANQNSIDHYDNHALNPANADQKIFCLEGPRMALHSYGHDKIEQSLISQYYNDTLPHAIIFEGVKGIGKATMAFRLAKFLLSRTPNQSMQDSMFDNILEEQPETLSITFAHPAVRRVLSGASPDFMVIEQDTETEKTSKTRSIAVKDVRRVPAFFRMTSSQGGWRVVIVDDADTMTRSAQNALLKILEEPPAKSLLIVVTHRLGRLIPTIRSRAQVINFKPLRNTLIESVLKQSEPDLTKKETDLILLMSQGSVGAALQYYEMRLSERLEDLENVISTYPNFESIKLHGIAEIYARANKGADYEVLRFLLLIIFKMLSSMLARKQSFDGHVLKGFENIALNLGGAGLITLYEDLDNLFETADVGNLDKYQCIMSAFQMIQNYKKV